MNRKGLEPTGVTDLLANTQTRSTKNRVAWTLKFTLPSPAADGTTRRFSAVPRGYGPSGAAGCCHGTVQSDLLYPSLLKKTRAPSGRPPLAFSRSPLDSLLAGFLFFFLILDVALLHKQPPRPRDRQVTMVLEESLVSFSSPPFSLLLKSVWVASWRHYSLFSPSTSSMCCSFLPGSSWADNASTGDHFRAAYSLGATDCVSGFPPFGQLFYGGLAGPRYLLEENI